MKCLFPVGHKYGCPTAGRLRHRQFNTSRHPVLRHEHLACLVTTYSYYASHNHQNADILSFFITFFISFTF